ncbi:ankyrin repeat domain-containing protein [Hydrogenophaga sp. ANAO-22]|jgi:ankyrin repeat protein|uniref:ankyrin repeat domain-containing protein n=1 Tax=Hydrogenophaga sp. ANAO-22 TaxID=3166645 RepID=UPI0036D2A0BF
MRSSEDARRLAWCTTLALAAGLGACAQHDPRQLALRDRIEQGALTPEDSERFFTGEREHQAVVSARRDVPPRLASALDRDLAQAVASGEVERARQLIKDGAQVNAVDAGGQTALLIAARAGDLEMARLLLRSAADPNGRGGPFTPLGAAALHGHAPLVRLLLRAGAEVDAVGLNGQTPLMNAIKLDRLDAAALLLQAGADTRTADRSGDDPLVAAIHEDRPRMLDLLLAHGADPNRADANGLTPLYWARQLQRDALAQRLLAVGAREDQQRQTLRASRPYPKEDF